MARLEHILKTNRFLQKIYVFVFTVFFRLIGLFIRTDKRLILFNSFSGKLFNDSPRVLYEAIISDEKYKDFKCIWAFNDPKKFKDKVHCKIVKQDSFKYFITALRAKYWITNVNIQRGLKLKRKNTVCLNTWHGTGPKTIGNAVRGRRDYNFQNIEFVLSDGPFLKDSFIKNFGAKPEHVYEIGRPREDVLFEAKKNLAKAKEDALKRLKLPANKKIVLFAPTWRETLNGGRTYDIGFSFNLNKWADVLGDDYVILFRAHSITNNYSIPKRSNIIDVTDVDDINDLYLASDILISDYSSCFTDFSILGKPMFCYAPDYDTYSVERGLVYDLNPLFTHGVIKNEDTLLKAILNLDYDLERFNSQKYNKLFVSSNGDATKKSLELLFSR